MVAWYFVRQAHAQRLAVVVEGLRDQLADALDAQLRSGRWTVMTPWCRNCSFCPLARTASMVASRFHPRPLHRRHVVQSCGEAETMASSRRRQPARAGHRDHGCRQDRDQPAMNCFRLCMCQFSPVRCSANRDRLCCPGTATLEDFTGESPSPPCAPMATMRVRGHPIRPTAISTAGRRPAGCAGRALRPSEPRPCSGRCWPGECAPRPEPRCRWGCRSRLHLERVQ